MRILIIICFIFIFPTAALGSKDSRQDYVYGTGNSTGGNIDTYVDPRTGDIVTSVRPPKNNNNQNNQGNIPIFVYPQVAPSWPPTPVTPPKP